MIESFSQGKLRWINLKRPTTDEVKKVMKQLDLSPALMTDLTAPIPRNRALIVDDVIKLTLDFPTVKKVTIGCPHEIKFIIGEKFLLTVQYEEMEGMDRFKRQFEVAATLFKNKKGKGMKHMGADIFMSAINTLYEATFSKLDYLESKLESVESEVFKSYKRDMVFEISEMNKKLVTFRHTLRGHEEIFRDARPLFDALYGDHFSKDFQNIQGQYFALLRHSNTLFDTLTALRDANTALINTRQNEIMKNLTIMAFITFPLTLLSSMFGMNTVTTPLVGMEGDFWVIVGIMSIAALFFFFWFKHKDWI